MVRIPITKIALIVAGVSLYNIIAIILHVNELGIVQNEYSIFITLMFFFSFFTFKGIPSFIDSYDFSAKKAIKLSFIKPIGAVMLLYWFIDLVLLVLSLGQRQEQIEFFSSAITIGVFLFSIGLLYFISEIAYVQEKQIQLEENS